MKKEVSKIENISFLMPSYVYIPFEKEENIVIPRNKYVYCCMNLGDENCKSVFSSVSGSIIGKKNMKTLNNESNSLVIANDYKDKKQKLIGGRKNISKYTKTEAVELLKTFNLYKETSNKKNILIYVNYDSFNLSNSYLVNERVYDILETADALSSIFNINRVVFVLNKNDDISYDIISKYIGSFINIDIVKTSKSYNKITSQNNDSLIYNVFELFEIYNVLKYKSYTKEKYISIFIKKKELKIIYTKIGVSLDELLTVLRLKTISNDISILTSNNEIKITDRDVIITKEIEAIKLN